MKKLIHTRWQDEKPKSKKLSKKNQTENTLKWAEVKEARALLRRYDLGKIFEVRKVTVGENATYRVRSARGAFALRLYRPDRWSEGAMRVEHAFMEHLGIELGVLAPIEGVDGDTLYPTSSCQGAIFPWVSGRMLHKGIRPIHCHRLGVRLAEIHQKSATFGRGAPRASWDRETLLTQPAELLRSAWPSFAGGERFPFGDSLELLGEVWSKLKPKETFLHADLHLGNIKFSKGEVFPIDFDDCGYGPIGYEFGVLGQYTLDRPALAAAFLEAYNSNAKDRVSSSEVDLFTAVRCIFLSSWILERPEIFSLKKQAELIRKYMQKVPQLALRSQSKAEGGAG